MPEQFDNTNRGVLFRNTKRREGKNDPEYSGRCNADGVDYWLSAWVKEGKDGKFFSLALKPMEPKTGEPSKKANPKPPAGDDGQDDVPF